MRLRLGDILDLRAYERGRDAFRARVIELKKVRRVPVGRLITLVFENADTIRFQIQEMARAERILTDEAIQTELDIYNPLIPEPGELSATLFVELTSQEELREWLPRLVGIERSVVLRLGPERREVRAAPEAAHEAALTREEMTASVHYIRFRLSPDEVELFRRGPVFLAVDHPAYREASELPPPTRDSLLADLLRGG